MWMLSRVYSSLREFKWTFSRIPDKYDASVVDLHVVERSALILHFWYIKDIDGHLCSGPTKEKSSY